MCSKRHGDAPAWNLARALHDAAIAADEEDVDGKAHEEGVHAAARGNDERVARVQAIAPEEAASAALPVRREVDTIGEQTPCPSVAQPALTGLFDERGEKRRYTPHATSLHRRARRWAAASSRPAA